MRRAAFSSAILAAALVASDVARATGTFCPDAPNERCGCGCPGPGPGSSAAGGGGGGGGASGAGGGGGANASGGGGLSPAMSGPTFVGDPVATGDGNTTLNMTDV